ncbi:PREDICTED: uncharacterized protein LOC104592022 [Nelumbo nucifera]|uniref:Retrotransposon Copia-like N-terminal domain-containing protein n=2 Tax=Nelumbo nucifera TaxID=4432 RepID=A0A822YFS2_NELNU|nr:PREDICTED: uncharacterized protein LOC104592022 [Nelumbo nucifera]DAD30321.1 TPA_asm: hypothetical protein HUJ06_009172 [Nelumbo nucifera]
MTTSSSTSNLLVSIDPASPFFLFPSSSPGSVLVSQLLTGDNYPTWQRAMKNALRAKNKIYFIDGSLSHPDPTSPEWIAWEKCNAMVVAWILNSMIKEIYDNVAFVDSASNVWKELEVRRGRSNGKRKAGYQHQLGAATGER